MPPANTAPSRTLTGHQSAVTDPKLVVGLVEAGVVSGGGCVRTRGLTGVRLAVVVVVVVVVVVALGVVAGWTGVTCEPVEVCDVLRLALSSGTCDPVAVGTISTYWATEDGGPATAPCANSNSPVTMPGARTIRRVTPEAYRRFQ